MSPTITTQAEFLELIEELRGMVPPRLQQKSGMS
jgi:hypothetical protein